MLNLGIVFLGFEAFPLISFFLLQSTSRIQQPLHLPGGLKKKKPACGIIAGTKSVGRQVDPPELGYPNFAWKGYHSFSCSKTVLNW